MWARKAGSDDGDIDNLIPQYPGITSTVVVTNRLCGGIHSATIPPFLSPQLNRMLLQIKDRMS
jgi:hypothetical protein